MARAERALLVVTSATTSSNLRQPSGKLMQLEVSVSGAPVKSELVAKRLASLISTSLSSTPEEAALKAMALLRSFTPIGIENSYDADTVKLEIEACTEEPSSFAMAAS